jgi:hypothetical protein
MEDQDTKRGDAVAIPAFSAGRDT